MINKNLKVFISSDMEGIAGTKRWADVDKSSKDYEKYTSIQTEELNCLISSINRYGNEICDADGIVRGYHCGNEKTLSREFMIRDAHGGGNNIISKKISHQKTTILQNWECATEMGMMSGLDNGFDAAILHGYHAAGGTKLSPLAHTFSHKHFKEFRLNGEIIGETTLAMYASAYVGVPVIMISGDSGAIAEAKNINPNILSVETKEFVNNRLRWMATSPNVDGCLYAIAGAAIRHLERAPERFYIRLPEHFTFNMTYKDSKQAFLQSKKIPDVIQISNNTVEFNTINFGVLLKTLRQLKFLVK